MREWSVGVALFVAVVLLYSLTFSSVPTSDGYTWTTAIDRADRDLMTRATHPLPLVVVAVLKQALSAVGVRVATLPLIQTVNALLAATGTVLVYRLVLLLGGGVVFAASGGALLAVSFAYWYFANGENHHFGTVVILAVFVAAVRRLTGGAPYGYGFVASLAVLNALAIMFHQDAALFGFSIVAMLAVVRPWRRAVKEAVVYLLAGTVGTAVFAVLIGVCLRGVSTVRELVAWYVWINLQAGLEPYEGGGVFWRLAQAAKAQLAAIVLGTQVVVDVAKRPALLDHASTLQLLALTGVASGLVGLLLLDAWTWRRAIRTRLLVPFVGCVVWVLAYKVLLNSWFQPPSTEYHLATVPPLILLLLFGPIAARAEPRAGTGRRRAETVIVVALAVALFLVDFRGGILPWQRYGEMKDALAARLHAELRPGDLSMSSESGLDSIFLARGEHLSVKDLFKRTPKAQAFETIDRLIRERIDAGGRVFVYNFAPSPFTLFGINRGTERRGYEPVSRDDLERFLDTLKTRYRFTPVAPYWEESDSPLYLYGERLDTLWVIREKARP